MLWRACSHVTHSPPENVLQGGILGGDGGDEVKDVLLLDVAPLSLGIETGGCVCEEGCGVCGGEGVSERRVAESGGFCSCWHVALACKGVETVPCT